MKTKQEMYDLGFITDYDGSILLRYIGKSKNVVIPEGVVTVWEEAFRNKRINSVKLPKSLKEIGEKAFEGNNLRSVDLENVEVIGRWAFAYNDLTELNLKNVDEVGDFAFWNNILIKVDMKNAMEIGTGAFRENPLRRFTYQGKTYKVDEANETLLEKVGIRIEEK